MARKRERYGERRGRQRRKGNGMMQLSVLFEKGSRLTVGLTKRRLMFCVASGMEDASSACKRSRSRGSSAKQLCLAASLGGLCLADVEEGDWVGWGMNGARTMFLLGQLRALGDLRDRERWKAGRVSMLGNGGDVEGVCGDVRGELRVSRKRSM